MTVTNELTAGTLAAVPGDSAASAALANLAAVAAATEVAVSDNPAHALIRPQVTTSLVTGTPTEVNVRTSSHEFTIDEPAALGGTNLGANPVEHLLAALGACQVITYQLWAAKLGVRVDEIAIDLSGDIDVRRFFGLDDTVRAGFESVRVDVRLSGPEPAERYEELTRHVELHCPVLDSLSNGVPVEAALTVN